jgi:hypothetical protein
MFDIFPNGIFSGLARLEIKKLSEKETPISEDNDDNIKKIIVKLIDNKSRNYKFITANVYFRKKEMIGNIKDSNWIYKGKTPFKDEIEPGKLVTIEVTLFPDDREFASSANISVEKL